MLRKTNHNVQVDLTLLGKLSLFVISQNIHAQNTSISRTPVIETIGTKSSIVHSSFVYPRAWFFRSQQVGARCRPVRYSMLGNHFISLIEARRARCAAVTDMSLRF